MSRALDDLRPDVSAWVEPDGRTAHVSVDWRPATGQERRLAEATAQAREQLRTAWTRQAWVYSTSGRPLEAAAAASLACDIGRPRQSAKARLEQFLLQLGDDLRQEVSPPQSAPTEKREALQQAIADARAAERQADEQLRDLLRLGRQMLGTPDAWQEASRRMELEGNFPGAAVAAMEQGAAAEKSGVVTPALQAYGRAASLLRAHIAARGEDVKGTSDRAALAAVECALADGHLLQAAVAVTELAGTQQQLAPEIRPVVRAAVYEADDRLSGSAAVARTYAALARSEPRTHAGRFFRREARSAGREAALEATIRDALRSGGGVITPAWDRPDRRGSRPAVAAHRAR